MTGPSNRCPDPEVLAAFVAGNLSGTELTMTAEHLRTCEDCRTIVGDIAYVARQDAPPVLEAPRPAWPWWLAAAAAALIGVLSLAYWSATARRADKGIRTLVVATPLSGRYIEPRLSGGFPWAPLRAAHRIGIEPLDAGQMKLVGAAGDVLDRTAGDRSVEAQHAAAVAHLVAGRPREAAALLAPLAERAADARTWTDLAAARLVVATQSDDSAQLAQALVAADAALRVDARFPEALFDRALILERLGLRQQAITAWQQYLTVDGTTSWAGEARQHVSALAIQSSFARELDSDYARFSADSAAARKLAARFPQEARTRGETAILGRWADAWQSQDPAAAALHLRLAHAFGEELAARTGERMLQSAVGAIEGADPNRKRALAIAHVEFWAARKLLNDTRPADAERTFVEAARHFEEGRSPLSLVAHYFAATAAYEQGRIAEAQAQLQTLVANVPPNLPAHLAQSEWELGLANAALGHWGEAMRLLRDSVATFERIGEQENASAVREILAEVYDQIGEPAVAWHHRLIALHEIGRTQNRRLRVAVESIAQAAILDRDWPAALSFLGVELEVIDKDDPMALVETLLMRASVQRRMGRPPEATVDLARATAAMSRLGDPAMREHAEVDRVAVAACLAPPRDAVAFLTRAIEFHRVKGRRLFLPEMFLERGHAFETTGNRAAAAEDYDRAIAELEAQRTSIAKGEERWGVFTAAGELFENAVALAVSRGDPQAAIAYAERSRARDVLDRVNVTAPSLTPPPVSDNLVVVEYASLPTHLIIFVIDRGRVRAVQEDVARGTLVAWSERLADSAATDDREEFRRTAAALYSRLIAPVADSVDVAHLVVFVPDMTLSGIPFSALIDGRGRYLVEQHAVVVTPSAAVYARLVSRPRPTSAPPRVLVIAGPPAREGELRDLAAVRREAEAVAAAYRDAVTLGPDDAERGALASRAAGVDVIHFVGHAVEPEGSGDAALVTSAAAGADLLNARDIASMRFTGVSVVVLAACSTARGRAGSRGLSVAQAFVAAGVPSVVATLWPIADGPASEFFPRLHRRLAERVPAAEALRSIQLEWIRRHDAPPGMWAAVEIIGS